MKKLLASICCLCLVMALCVPAFASAVVDETENGKLEIGIRPASLSGTNLTSMLTAYTDGADNAFDGDTTTSFAGSVTMQFSKRTVTSGMKITSDAPLYGLKISGSEDGTSWIEVYNQDVLNGAVTFGSDGNWGGDVEHAYTYAWSYLRFEIVYGSIAEIELYGYQMSELTGISTERDMMFADGVGHLQSTFYGSNEDLSGVFDHIVSGSSKHAGVVNDATLGELANRAHITVKVPDNAGSITAIAVIRGSESSKYMTRWDNVQFEFSTDGTTWTNACGLEDYSSNIPTGLEKFWANQLIVANVDPDAGYRYARVVNSAYTFFGTFNIYTENTSGATVPTNILNGWEGDTFVAETPSVAYGVQTTPVAGGEYDMRFVGIFAGDYKNVDSVGFKVVASWTDSESATQIKTFDKTSTTLYNSLTANEGGTIKQITAGDGEYLFALTVNGIPTDAEITFSIISYVVIGETTFESAAKTATATYDADTNTLTVTPTTVVIADTAA